MVNDLARLEAAFTLLEELAPMQLATPSDRMLPARRPRFVVVGAAVAAVVLAVSGAAWLGVHRRAATTPGVSGAFQYSAPTELGHLIPVADRRRAGNFSAPALASSAVPSTRGSFRLSTFVGQVVAINYWASWCSPCRTELAALSRLAAATAHPGVDVVGIATRDTRAAASSLVGSANPRGLPFYFDGPGRTAQQLGGIPVETLPVTVIVDRRGRIAAVYHGALTFPDLRGAVNAVAAER